MSGGQPFDDTYMAIALRLGRRGLGRCWPNPAVGCVIVNGTRIVGRGWTGDGGRPHAETEALRRAGTAAKGATAYVTLEPCAHHGRTPPCADALIAAGMARVVFPFADPDPRVNGAGKRKLADGGVEVDEGVSAAAARAAHSGFLKRQATGRPEVTLKLATSVDGRIATASGESRWITGPMARRWVHAERARHDAVLIGGGTARADDPTLTVRGLGITHQPVRVVASAALSIDPDGNLARSANLAPVLALHGPAATGPTKIALEKRGVRCLEVATGPDGRLDPGACLDALGAWGLTRVFCEGGGTFGAALLAGGHIDRALAFTAGVAIGAEGRPAIGPMALTALADAPRFDLVETRAIGGDTLQVWQPAA